MGIVKEFILYAAGLVLTVGLLFIGFGMYRKTAELGKIYVEREQRVINDYAEYEIYKYDGNETKGNNIISYIKRVYGVYDADRNIRTEKNTFKANSENISMLRNVDSAYYINPLKDYSVKVHADDNGSIRNIDINQVK